MLSKVVIITILSLTCIVTPSLGRVYYHDPQKSAESSDESDLSVWNPDSDSFSEEEALEGRTATPTPPRFVVQISEDLPLPGMYQKVRSSLHRLDLGRLPKRQPKQYLQHQRPAQLFPKFLIPKSWGGVFRQAPTPDDLLKTKLHEMLKDSMSELNWKIKLLRTLFAENKDLRNDMDIMNYVNRAHKELTDLFEEAEKSHHFMHPIHLLRAYDELQKGNRLLTQLVAKVQEKSKLNDPNTTPSALSRIAWSYYDDSLAFHTD